MTQAPEAIFVVERRPGQGYTITSATGARAPALQRAAVEILDQLGQPDPRGPEEIERWLPAAGPDQQPLFVRIRRTAEGESVYHQSWFPANLPPARPRRTLWPWFAAAALLFLAGGATGWTCRGQHPEAQPERQVKPEPGEKQGPRPDPPTVSRTDALLQLPMRRAREVRKKMAEFLKQPGLSGWPEEPGVVEETVRVNDNRKATHGVKIEPVYLTSDEVRALRTLLEALDGVP
jgi:hypothetical protein